MSTGFRLTPGVPPYALKKIRQHETLTTGVPHKETFRSICYRRRRPSAPMAWYLAERCVDILQQPDFPRDGRPIIERILAARASAPTRPMNRPGYSVVTNPCFLPPISKNPTICPAPLMPKAAVPAAPGTSMVSTILSLDGPPRMTCKLGRKPSVSPCYAVPQGRLRVNLGSSQVPLRQHSPGRPLERCALDAPSSFEVPPARS